MKRTFLALAVSVIPVLAAAQTPKNVKYVFTEASDLNLIGKVIDTPNPYHRVDTCEFKGFDRTENAQVRCSAGLAVLFRTNSTSIAIESEFGYRNYGMTTMPLALRGYDLYVRKDGKWLWAASKVNGVGKENDRMILIQDMDGEEKECMLYLPMYSELYSVRIGVDEGSEIESLDSPFRHRIAIFGSSYTQGISTARSGMSYPMQLMRKTGIQFLSLACSGHCKLQPYFADVLAAADVDAIVFDAFSNLSAKGIEERLFPFIERIRASKPDTPLVFMQTIYRENRNFNVSSDKYEQAKQDVAAELMAEAVKKYRNVYFIQTNATSPDHETSVDGVHPSDYGYTLWARSIEKPLLKILKKHGLK